MDIPAPLGYPQRRSVQGPRSRAERPSRLPLSSLRSSTTATRKYRPASPEESRRARSRRKVVFPDPGSPATSTDGGGPERYSCSGRLPAAPGIFRAMRKFRLPTSRRARTRPCSADAVPAIPTRWPPSRVRKPWAASSSQLCTEYPQARRKASAISSEEARTALGVSKAESRPSGKRKRIPSAVVSATGWSGRRRISQISRLFPAGRRSKNSHSRVPIQVVTCSYPSISFPSFACLIIPSYAALPADRTGKRETAATYPSLLIHGKSRFH